MRQVWAVTIGGTILQNGLAHRLPTSSAAQFGGGGGASIAYAVVPQIPVLPQPLQDEVRDAFAQALSTLWTVLIGVSVLGLLVSLPMKGLPLHDELDTRWTLERKDDASEIGRAHV